MVTDFTIREYTVHTYAKLAFQVYLCTFECDILWEIDDR